MSTTDHFEIDLNVTVRVKLKNGQPLDRTFAKQASSLALREVSKAVREMSDKQQGNVDILPEDIFVEYVWDTDGTDMAKAGFA